MERGEKKAIILVGHGSKFRGFDAPLKKIKAALQKNGEKQKILLAYLEINSPSIPEAIDVCVKRGASTIKILPYFVLWGNHVKNHIPQIITEAKKRHRGKAKLILCPYLGYHKKIVDVVKERLKCW